MSDKPNYYAIIPAFVRYDKDLSPNAKLLYGEISSLCNEKGFCWATNSYFEELYEMSSRSIQRLIKQLTDKNYIIVEIENNTKRKIFITESYNITPDKNVVGGMTKMSRGNDKNVTHNNKMNIKDEINKKRTNLTVDVPLFDYDWLNNE